MRRTRRIELSEILREHREELERSLTDVAERGTSLSPLEARLIVRLSEARLRDVEHALRRRGRVAQFVVARTRFAETRIRRLAARPRRLATRIRGLKRPKIGRLNQHPPKPLEVPAKYFKTVPPIPSCTISIVTPSYQQGRFIGKTIASVLGQNYPSLEYVVQDGGSTDGTTEVLNEFGAHLTTWRSEPDNGQAEAINKGFAHTSGEIMGWLNSDDLLLPGALAYIGRFFATHPDVDVIYGNRILIDDNDSEVGLWILPNHDDTVLTLADYVPQESLFWRREIWKATGSRVDPSFGFAVDWDLLLRFRDAGARMVHVSRFLGAFRVHDGQKTTIASVLGAEECERLRERVHGRIVPIEEVVERIRPYLRRHVIVHNVYRLLSRFPHRREPVPLPAETYTLRAAPATTESERLQISTSS